MSSDFPHGTAAVASSVAGRVARFLGDAISAAWRSSSVGAAARSAGHPWRTAPTPAVVRAAAMAVAIAAGLQPLLSSVMPETVTPALPWSYILIAGFAGVAAWRAELLVRAWPDSVFARRIRR